jgi:hypothetical protein
MKVEITHDHKRDRIHRDEDRTRDREIALSESEREKDKSYNISNYSKSIVEITILYRPFFKEDISESE